MKRKSLCIVGGIYDMDVMPLETVKEYVQTDLDYIYGSDKIKFDMSEGETGAYHLVFKRKYGEWYNPERTVFSEKTVFAPDAHILLGTNRKDHPTEANLDKYDNACLHYISLSDVLTEFQKASKTRGSEKVQSLDVEERDGEVEFIVGF